MTKRIKHRVGIGEIAIIIGLFVILYNPPIFTFNCMHIVGAASIIYIIIYNRAFLRNEYARWFIIFMVIETYLFIMVVGIHNHGFTGVVFPLYYILDVIPFSIVIKDYFDRNEIEYKKIISYSFIAALAQSVLSILSFINPQIQKVIVDRIIELSGVKIYSYWSTIRMYGFSNGLMFEMPAIQTILAIIGFYYAITIDWKYLILSSIYLFTAIINARTSYVLLLAGIIVLIVFSSKKRKINLKGIIGIVISGTIIIAFIFPLIRQISPQTYNWMSKGIEEILGFLNGDTETGYFSYVTNNDRYVLPSSVFGVLFGEGTSIAGGLKKLGFSSDIGFINDIWVGGLVYVTFLYISVFLRIKKMIDQNTNFIKFIGIVLLTSIFILNFKGRVFAMNGVLNFLIIVQPLLEEKSLKKNKGVSIQDNNHNNCRDII